MAKLTTEEVIAGWLSMRRIKNPVIASHDVEVELPNYGRFYHDVLHTPGTYSRCWRKLRQTGKLRELGYELEDISTNQLNHGESAWHLKLAS